MGEGQLSMRGSVENFFLMHITVEFIFCFLQVFLHTFIAMITAERKLSPSLCIIGTMVSDSFDAYDQHIL